MNPFRRLLKSAGHQPPLGCWLQSGSPLMAEAMGHAGFDWGVIDLEHLPPETAGITTLLQALGSSRLLPVLRLGWSDAMLVRRVLDSGAATLLFSRVRSAAEAHQAVATTRFPPDGVRGLSEFSRASRFGMLPGPLHSAQPPIGVIVQIDSAQAVAQIEAIAAVPGIDALFVDPAELATSLGLPGQPLHAQVLTQTADAVRRARQLDVPIGTLALTQQAATRYRAMAFDYLAVASDLGLVMQGAVATLRALRTQDGSGHVHTLSHGTHTDSAA